MMERIRNAFLGLLGVVAGTTHIFLAPTVEEQNRRLSLWATRILKWLKLPIEVIGQDHLKDLPPAIVVSNHLSQLDIPLFFSIWPRPLRMAAKIELVKIPLLGWAIKKAGFIPLPRQRHREAIQALDNAKKLLEKGMDFYLAAEGTRSRDGKLLPFKKGPFVLAIRFGVPVVPVTLIGTYEALPKGSSFPKSHVPLKVIIHPPLSVEGLTHENRDHLRDQAYNIIRQSLIAHGKAV